MADPKRASDAQRRAQRRRARPLERDLTAAYQQVWARIRAELAATIAQAEADQASGRKVTTAVLLRQDRLQNLLGQVVAEVNLIADFSAQGVATAQADAVLGGRIDAESLIQTALGTAPPGAAFTPAFPTEAFRELVGFATDGGPLGDLLAELGSDAGARVRTALLTGLATGQNPRAIARHARDALGGNMARALTIARTEVLRSYREATRQTYKANRDVVQGWVWNASLDRRTCAMCVAMHGTVHGLDETMDTHPSCFPAGTLVVAPQTRAATKRWYSGELIEIQTASGRRLPVTPNHPMLTTEGWIPAGELREGAHLVSGAEAERMAAAVDPDHEHVPARIEQVAEALRRAGRVTAARVPATTEDFHGDGLDGEVDVVRADGLLRHRGEVGEPLGEQQLCGRHVALAEFLRERGLAALFQRGLPAATGGVRGGGVASVLLGTPGGHAQAVRFGLSAQGDAAADQSKLDRAARGPVLRGQSVDRGPGRVFHDERVVGQREPASVTFADRVVAVTGRGFAGHVYNVETAAGWYVANGIIVHNCRCSMLPQTVTWAELGFDVPETRADVEPGTEWFARQDEALQREMLGPGKLAAYRAGRITLPDLVEVTHHPRWGRGRRERSLRDALAS